MEKKTVAAYVNGGTLAEVSQRFKAGGKIGTYGTILRLEQVGQRVKIVFEALANMVVIAYGVISDAFLGRCTLNTQTI